MITVSLASAQAADVIATLVRAQLLEHEIETPADLLHEVVDTVLADARHGFFLLASDDGETVGISYAASHLSAEHGGIVGWLEEIYVRPAWRGRGIGAALLKATVARAQELRWRGVELEVVAGHERAAALYLRHGFTPLRRTRYTRLFAT